MKTFRTIAALAAFSMVMVAAADASGSKAAAKGPKVTAQSPKGGSKAPKSGAQSAAPKTKSTSTAAPSSPKSGKAHGASKKSSARNDAGTTAGSAETSTTSTTTPTSPTTPPVAEPNAISTKISGKPEQLAKVTAMLPQGMTLEQATAGFKNQGQFLATLNASKNQGLNFADLQKAVTVEGLSVGQAVKKVKSAPGGSL